MCEEAAGSSFFTFKVFDVSSGAESGRKGQKKNDSKHRTRVCVCVCVWTSNFCQSFPVECLLRQRLLGNTIRLQPMGLVWHRGLLATVPGFEGIGFRLL